MTSFRLRILAQTLPFLLIAPAIALAQAPPTRSQATAALNQPANPAAARYTRQQIDQLVAPIALYPDQLLAQVLMAATYPQQIEEAAQWLKDPSHAELKGDALVEALRPLPWDPGVKALVAFPQIIAMMSEHIEWTQALGVAFATQQAEVMARVQALRQLAMKSGKLKQVRHLVVRQEGPAIVIVPAEPERVYVPVYNPTVVYGEWADRDYPPVFIPPPQGFVAETIEPGFELSAGYALVGPLWGWSRPDWRSNRIIVNTTEYTRFSRDVPLGPNNSWRHNGPVVLVAPGGASRTTAAAGTVPAGTVAPSAAGAVVSLPQRAAAQPTLIQTQGATTRTTQPGQTPTTAQPAAPEPGKAPTTTARPTVPEPGKAPTTTAQPATPEPGKPATATAQPTTPPPGKPPATTAQPTPSGQPPKTQATTSPGEHKPGQAPAAPSEAAKSQGKATEPAASLPKEHAPAATATKPTEPGTPRAPEQAGAKPPGGAPEQPTRAPEHAGGKPPSAPQEQPVRAPEQAGAKPPAAPQGQPGHMPEQAGAKPPAGSSPSGGSRPAEHAPQRPAATEPGAQGTSAPPAAGAPHQAAPGPQRQPEPGAHPPGQPPEQGEKKER